MHAWPQFPPVYARLPRRNPGLVVQRPHPHTRGRARTAPLSQRRAFVFESLTWALVTAFCQPPFLRVSGGPPKASRPHPSHILPLEPHNRTRPTCESARSCFNIRDSQWPPTACPFPRSPAACSAVQEMRARCGRSSQTPAGCASANPCTLVKPAHKSEYN